MNHEDYDNEQDYCPACFKMGYTSKLSSKIIYVEETKRGPKISKNPIFALGLDPEKQYRQCRECGNIYDLDDLPSTIMNSDDPEQEEINRAYREGNYIPGPGTETRNGNRLNTTSKKLADLVKTEISEAEPKTKPQGKIKQVQRARIKKSNTGQ